MRIRLVVPIPSLRIMKGSEFNVIQTGKEDHENYVDVEHFGEKLRIWEELYEMADELEKK